jgi:two-component system, NarL family, sensor histidine kinase DegS
MSQQTITRVAIIGAGRGGTSLIKILHNDPLVRIVGVVDLKPNTPGIRLAKRLKIPVTNDYRKLLRSKQADLVIDVTGNKEVEQALLAFKHPSIAVIGGASAKFMWQLIEERIKNQEAIERHLHEYQSLYSLYVKETYLAISEERTRIALDIHDGLVQTLIGLAYHFDVYEGLQATDPVLAQKRLKEIKDLLKAVIEEARNVIFNLRPLSFEKGGLLPALKNYLSAYERQYRIKTDLKVSVEEKKIPPKHKVFLFRIVQEALSNVHRHAKAKRAWITLEMNHSLFKITIQDDGIGFDPRQAERNREKWASFGLRGIQERCRLLGGTAVIESHPGHGTRITIELPLE